MKCHVPTTMLVCSRFQNYKGGWYLFLKEYSRIDMGAFISHNVTYSILNILFSPRVRKFIATNKFSNA